LSSADLTDLEWLKNLSNLTSLNVSDNKFPVQTLSAFSSLSSLKELFINSNNFVGSLQPIRNLIALKELNISHTKLDSGLGYLSQDLENFIFGGTAFKKELAPYQGSLKL
jgi:Leucine-rich repeat (LRR) protein